jgi:hypothetical protein
MLLVGEAVRLRVFEWQSADQAFASAHRSPLDQQKSNDGNSYCLHRSPGSPDGLFRIRSGKRNRVLKLHPATQRLSSGQARLTLHQTELIEPLHSSRAAQTPCLQQDVQRYYTIGIASQGFLYKKSHITTHANLFSPMCGREGPARCFSPEAGLLT